MALERSTVKGLVKGFESTITENDVFLHVIALREKTWKNPSQPFTPSHRPDDTEEPMSEAADWWCEAACWEEYLDELTEAALDGGEDCAKRELPEAAAMWLRLIWRSRRNADGSLRSVEAQ
jgi:hypothetical protein